MKTKIQTNLYHQNNCSSGLDLGFKIINEIRVPVMFRLQDFQNVPVLIPAFLIFVPSPACSPHHFNSKIISYIYHYNYTKV